jgi:hypothetical protein
VRGATSHNRREIYNTADAPNPLESLEKIIAAGQHEETTKIAEDILFRCLEYVAALDSVATAARETAIDCLILAITDYFEQNHEPHDY